MQLQVHYLSIQFVTEDYITFTQEICNKNVHACQCLSSLLGCGHTVHTLCPQEVSFIVFGREGEEDPDVL